MVILHNVSCDNSFQFPSRYLQVELSSAESIRKYAGRKPDAAARFLN